MKRLFHGKLLIKLIFILALFLLYSSSFSEAATSPDAIAFRVMPNSNHLSPLRWYLDNNFKGAPQALTVDGYEAVRDGRTVYVNAANVSNISGSDFYTNIYIISYNQAAENPTIDIFGQILAHWKFNSNITDPLIKAAIVRDTKRLADLADIKSALANYQGGHNGDYPNLSAGSYLNGKTISTWPSWRATLGAALAIAMPLDPVNKLGTCPAGYDPVTCWDQINKKFYDPTPPPTNNEFNLPTGSRAYVYSYNGSRSYNICALMESGYLTTLDQGACAGSAVGYRKTCVPTNPSCTAANTCAGRTCNDGCSVIIGTKPDCSCVLPWGETIASGQNVTAYQTSSVLYNSNCISQVRTCTNGSLSGSYTKKSCTVSAAMPCVLSWGGTVSSSQSVTAYQAGSVACGSSCVSEIRTCDNGILSGSYINKVCSEDVCACTPESNATFCSRLDKNCGSVTANDNCGASRTVSSCGTCTSPQTCGGNNICACSATCNDSNQPNCQDSAPDNSVAGTGVCCGGQSCYKCAANYTWDGSTCVSATQTVSCAAKPANTDWNISATVLQTWDGLAWQPSNASSHDITAGDCKYQCQAGFKYDSGSGLCVNNYYISCLDLKNGGNNTNGVYAIDPDGLNGSAAFNVYCDMATDGGGWTLIMKAINAKFTNVDPLWENSGVLNESNFDFTTGGGKSKYQSFNAVSFNEIKTSDSDDFSKYFKYDLGKSYSSAKDLFYGPGVEISSGSLNNYFNDRTPAAGKHWAACGIVNILNVGINQVKYLTDYGAYGGGGKFCDWGGGARFGQRVNGYHGSSGDMQGQGWGTRDQIDETNGTDNYNFPISQLLWVR